jgi:hypothetical protein
MVDKAGGLVDKVGGLVERNLCYLLFFSETIKKNKNDKKNTKNKKTTNSYPQEFLFVVIRCCLLFCLFLLLKCSFVVVLSDCAWEG